MAKGNKKTEDNELQDNDKFLNDSVKITPKRSFWMITTFIIGILLVVSLFFAFIGGITGLTGKAISEEDAVQQTIDFVSRMFNVDLQFQSVSETDDSYMINFLYEGKASPLEVTKDFSFMKLPSGNWIKISEYEEALALQNAGTNNQPAGEQQVVDVEIGDSPIKGSADAPLTIVEFSDYQCPFCTKFYQETLPLIDENYIKTGKLKLVFKDFPLNFHEQAQKAAEAARCAREQKTGKQSDEMYFKYHDKLFENQQSLSIENFKKWAKELGLSSSKFDSCLDSGKYTDAVKEDAAYGASIGISGTPGFFINGIKVTGAQPYNVFEELIEKELAKE